MSPSERQAWHKTKPRDEPIGAPQTKGHKRSAAAKATRRASPSTHSLTWPASASAPLHHTVDGEPHSRSRNTKLIDAILDIDRHARELALRVRCAGVAGRTSRCEAAPGIAKPECGGTLRRWFGTHASMISLCAAPFFETAKRPTNA